jgi:dihydroorotase
MLTRREFSKCVLAGGSALIASESAVGLVSAATPPASPQSGPNQDIDLLIQGGTVIDPGQQLHATRDVAVKNGKIVEVSESIPAARARTVFLAKGKIVTPGLIDLHLHAYDGVAACVNVDHYCFPRGTTTVVDAGTTGHIMVGRFITDVLKTSQTRVYTMVHICPIGPVSGLPHPLENLDWVNPVMTAEAADAHRPYVIAIKVHLSKGYSSSPQTHEKPIMDGALKAAELSHLPLMVHLNDTYYPLRDNLDKLRKGDVFTHCFNAFPTTTPLDANGKILPEVRAARQRGVIFDIAPGFMHPHFTFDIAEKCMQQDFPPDTISTDLNRANAAVGIYDMPTMVSKFLALGMNLDKAIECATTNPGKVFNYGVQIGTLRPGSEADIGIFDLEEGSFEFKDAVGSVRKGKQKLVSHAVVSRGQLFANEAGTGIIGATE